VPITVRYAPLPASPGSGQRSLAGWA
jgi:hypothetical protein